MVELTIHEPEIKQFLNQTISMNLFFLKCSFTILQEPILHSCRTNLRGNINNNKFSFSRAHRRYVFT